MVFACIEKTEAFDIEDCICSLLEKEKINCWTNKKLMHQDSRFMPIFIPKIN